MFELSEIKKIISSIKNPEEYSKIKKIVNRSEKYGCLAINLEELNILLRHIDCKFIYDIRLLAEYFKENKIGYTKIIRDLGIPKATLSQMLNSGRNIKISTLNRIFDYYKISKDVLRREN